MGPGRGAWEATLSLPPAIPILLYHSVSERAAPRYRRFNVEPALFRAQLDLIAAEGCTPIELSQVIAALGGGGTPALPNKPVVLTFDDGFDDFHRTVMPELSHRRLPASLFVVAGRMGGQSDWLRGVGEGGRRLMTPAMVREVAELGVEIGAHGLTHVALDELRRGRARRELAEPKRILEDLIGRPVLSFAYPYGYHDRWLKDAVAAAGYDAALAVKQRLSHPGDDRYALARLIVPDEAPSATLGAWLRGEGAPLGSEQERLATTGWRQVRRVRAALAPRRPRPT